MFNLMFWGVVFLVSEEDFKLFRICKIFIELCSGLKVALMWMEAHPWRLSR